MVGEEALELPAWACGAEDEDAIALQVS